MQFVNNTDFSTHKITQTGSQPIKTKVEYNNTLKFLYQQVEMKVKTKIFPSLIGNGKSANKRQFKESDVSF